MILYITITYYKEHYKRFWNNDIIYYNLKTLELVKKRNLILVNIRELNRELYIGLSTLYTKSS